MSDYDYSSYGGGDFQTLHILDFICLFLVLCLVTIPLYLGITSQNLANQVDQKKFQIAQVQKALDSYFVASSNIPGERKYPTSVCSGQPNEVDYEYTLLRHLSGQETKLNNFAYINDKDFPLDPFGYYSNTKNNRPIKLRICEGVFDQSNSNQVYPDNLRSCNFQKNHPDTKYRNCYLYSTDNRGFEYQLAYYDEVKDQYVIATKNREQKATITVVDR
jgi:hypothetical protein